MPTHHWVCSSVSCLFISLAHFSIVVSYVSIYLGKYLSILDSNPLSLTYSQKILMKVRILATWLKWRGRLRTLSLKVTASTSSFSWKLHSRTPKIPQAKSHPSSYKLYCWRHLKVCFSTNGLRITWYLWKIQIPGQCPRSASPEFQGVGPRSMHF